MELQPSSSSGQSPPNLQQHLYANFLRHGTIQKDSAIIEGYVDTGFQMGHWRMLIWSLSTHGGFTSKRRISLRILHWYCYPWLSFGTSGYPEPEKHRSFRFLCLGARKWTSTVLYKVTYTYLGWLRLLLASSSFGTDIDVHRVQV